MSDLLEMYEQMAVIRRTEKASYDLVMTGLVKGTTHLAAGQEAVAVGASAALRPDDYVFATYRGHHHGMARGANAEATGHPAAAERRRTTSRPRSSTGTTWSRCARRPAGRARAGDGPSVIEAETYRQYGRPRTYRCPSPTPWKIA